MDLALAILTIVAGAVAVAAVGSLVFSFILSLFD